jgi:hypothetical protein
MANIALKDILIGARQESYRMRHFYVGAEHLFIALLEIKGSLANSILQEHGLAPEYVIDAIRRKVGKGGKHRLWAGVPNTPRAQVLLGIANDLALESGREEISERDLLIAIFEEKDSVPLRVLTALGVNETGKLADLARTYSLNPDSQRPYVRIDMGTGFDHDKPLTKEQVFILRRMFYGYSQVRVERYLTGGYSGATLLIVTPILADGREDAAIAVKIDQVDAILDEAQRYETLVKTRLPAMTARIEDRPVSPETSGLAAIKYTLVTGSDKTPQDLRTVMHQWEPEQLGSWLKNELFPAFGRTWWQQSRPYRFQVWQEYDWLLPPILTIEYSGDQELRVGHSLKAPLKRAKLDGIEYGDIVSIENFAVHKVNPDRNTVQLAVGHGTDSARAFKIEVRDANFSVNTYYRGEVLENVVGQVWKTRSEQLINAVRTLSPDFDPQADVIPSQIDSPENLPNPIIAYEALLDTHVNGTLSTIHGDLYPGNIMIGPNQSAFLIDFAHTRDGHTLFDWAMLETSLLSEYVLPTFGDSWEDARAVLQQLVLLNRNTLQPDAQTPIARILEPVSSVRDIVRSCLASDHKWAEYFIALVFCGLRAITWETLPTGGRRLMFLGAALALHELDSELRLRGQSDSPSPDETDLSISPSSDA